MNIQIHWVLLVILLLAYSATALGWFLTLAAHGLSWRDMWRKTGANPFKAAPRARSARRGALLALNGQIVRRA